MSGNGKLAHEAQSRGYKSVAEMVIAAVEKTGTLAGAAAFCNVAPNAIAVWLATNGLAIVKETNARVVRVEASDELEPA